MILLKVYILLFLLHIKSIESMLFPQKNEIRSYDLLNGLWTFVMEPKNSIGYGFINKWHKLKLSTFRNSTVMPVPSAYNDLGTDEDLRDHVGWVWYQREYYVTKGDCNKRFLIRFSSVNYNAVVVSSQENY
uniref:Glyco_hydro_2_N domain-containing protein n=1 Tax=Strongyloides papillosus TaxID=174720 RepID=A0A0N5B320_STREA